MSIRMEVVGPETSAGGTVNVRIGDQASMVLRRNKQVKMDQ